MPNEETPAVTQQPTETPTVQSGEGKTQPTPNPDRTFNRQEVTTILKKRLDRAYKGIYSKVGVEDEKGFDEFLNKVKDYDSIVTERDNQKAKISELIEKVAFMENNVNPDRYEDVKTYFKGLGQSFDSTSLAEMIKTHPEWVNKPVSTAKTTTIKPLGTEISPKKSKSEQELAEEIFGFKL